MATDLFSVSLRNYGERLTLAQRLCIAAIEMVVSGGLAATIDVKDVVDHKNKKNVRKIVFH